MNSFDIFNGHNGAKLGQVDITVEDEDDQEQPIALRAEACLMQEYGLTWEERQAMRDRDGPTEPLKLIAIMDLVKTGDVLKITYTKPEGWEVYDHELLMASLLAHPTFFKGVVDVEFEVDGDLDDVPDPSESEAAELDLQFVYKQEHDQGAIPRAKVLARLDTYRQAVRSMYNKKNGNADQLLHCETMEHAYVCILDLLCKPAESPMKRARV
jgi:hypothetical protein